MSKHEKSESLAGRLQQLLFSPKGDLEGLLLLASRSKTIQVTKKFESDEATELNAAIGEAIEVEASADHSPKTRHAAHPVYQLIQITRLRGRIRKSPRDAKRTRGAVAAVHYTKHGEPNGVILESGEFIHTGPEAMKEWRPNVGSKVRATGKSRLTVLGTTLIEADEVNGIKIAG